MSDQQLIGSGHHSSFGIHSHLGEIGSLFFTYLRVVFNLVDVLVLPIVAHIHSFETVSVYLIGSYHISSTQGTGTPGISGCTDHAIQTSFRPLQ